MKYDGTNLKEVLEAHNHWLNEDCEDWEGMMADLSWVDLSWAYLSEANLSMTNLSRANLSEANLSGADLSWADLSWANLSGADLSEADLSWADLSWANLSGADLSWADLSWANLSRANLSGADLSKAKLPKGEEYRKGVILRDDMIGYKKCYNGVIVTLKIPKGSVVFCINGSKCRANSAIVTAIDGAERAYSQHNGMSYYVGDRFNIWNFDCEYNNECSTGIHFFRTRKEAENY